MTILVMQKVTRMACLMGWKWDTLLIMYKIYQQDMLYDIHSLYYGSPIAKGPIGFNYKSFWPLVSVLRALGLFAVIVLSNDFGQFHSWVGSVYDSLSSCQSCVGILSFGCAHSVRVRCLYVNPNSRQFLKNCLRNGPIKNGECFILYIVSIPKKFLFKS